MTLSNDFGLSEWDLRAAFSLIPSSPSFLDNTTGLSTWTPFNVIVPPILPPE